ncbi:MAG: T9SS type A sorting domain-containing protein [bacterium]
MKRKENAVALGLVILLIPLTLHASADSFQEQALFLQHTENGLMVVEQQGLPFSGDTEPVDDPAVVWSHYLTDAVYTTTSNTVSGYVFAGTYLNPPMEAQLFAPGGGGTPEWGYSGTKFYADAGDAAFTLAAVDDNGSGVNVSKWAGPGSGTPDWTASFPGYGTTSYGPFAVSDDGSTIAAIAAPSGTDAHLLLFDADSSIPLIDYVAAGLGFPRYVKINADGRYTAFIALATLVVFDRDLLSVRDQISMGASNSALDISGDGNLVAYGWPSLVLMEWTGSSYQNLWTYSAGGGYYLSRIAISNDGSTMVSCWYNSPHNTIKVMVHDTGSFTPLWIYDYPTSSGTYQEVCYDIDITDDGAYFIIGSWGDDANLNPEVHIFQRDSTPHIYYTVDMPGSMFSVDIANDGSYATAAGKHIHANVSGRGGDIVMINTDITGIANTDSYDIPHELILLDVFPNPFSKLTKVSFSIEHSAERMDLKIFNSSGQLVKSFDHESCILDHGSTIRWDGTDQDNRQLGGGVYFVQLATGEQIISEKIVKLE